MLRVNFRLLGQVGLVLFFVGVFLSWKLQSLNVLPRFVDIGLILILSLVFIYASYRTEKVACKNVIVIVLLILLLLYGLIASIFLGDIKNIIWCMFGLVAVFVFSRIDYSRIIFDEWGVGFSIVMCLLFISETGVSSLGTGLARQSVGEDNAAYGLAAYCSINALLFAVASASEVSGRKYILLAGGAFLLSFLIILLTGVRSPLFGFFVCSMVLFYRMYWRSDAGDRLLILLVFTFVFGYVLATGSVVGDILESVNVALRTLLGSSDYVVDAAALGRNFQREEAIYIFSENVFLGAGFKYFWVDFPLLQALSDGGLLFGLGYLFVYFLYLFPKSVRGVFDSNTTVVFFSLLYVCNAPRLFLHGQPMDWQHMVYTIPVICFFAFDKTNVNIKSGK